MSNVPYFYYLRFRNKNIIKNIHILENSSTSGVQYFHFGNENLQADHSVGTCHPWRMTLSYGFQMVLCSPVRD